MSPLYARDRQRNPLRDKRIAIIGFGSQGQAHALNLRDNGHDVVVGLRRTGRSWARAHAAGLRVCTVPEAVWQADVAMLLIPDEEQPAVFKRDVAPQLRAGAYLGFAHGLCVHIGRIVPPADTNVFLAAPQAPGRLMRQQVAAGVGVPCLVAIQQDPSGQTREVALAYACGIGCGRAGVQQTTFREETETALFGRQAVLCGGLTEVIHACFETLVNNGYAPEIACLECLRELNLVTDLIQERGVTGMRAGSTAATRGRHMIDPAARDVMQQALHEIQSGRFADEWFADAVPPADTACAATRPDSKEYVNHELDWPGFDAAPSWYLRGRC